MYGITQDGHTECDLLGTKTSLKGKVMMHQVRPHMNALRTSPKETQSFLEFLGGGGGDYLWRLLCMGDV